MILTLHKSPKFEYLENRVKLRFCRISIEENILNVEYENMDIAITIYS